MNIEQMLSMKSKEEACFIFYNKCIQCNHFNQNKWGSWNCESPWHEQYCREKWEKFLENILDKNIYN